MRQTFLGKAMELLRDWTLESGRARARIGNILNVSGFGLFLNIVHESMVAQLLDLYGS